MEELVDQNTDTNIGHWRRLWTVLQKCGIQVRILEDSSDDHSVWVEGQIETDQWWRDDLLQIVCSVGANDQTEIPDQLYQNNRSVHKEQNRIGSASDWPTDLDSQYVGVHLELEVQTDLLQFVERNTDIRKIVWNSLQEFATKIVVHLFGEICDAFCET